MPKRGWEHGVAIGLAFGFVLSLLTWIPLEQMGLLQPAKERPRTAVNSSQPAQNSPAQTPEHKDYSERARAFLWGIERQRNAEPAGDKSETDAEKTPYKDALDLAAQWATADAARLMVILTVGQMLIGGIGLVAIWRSLTLNKRAIEVAAEANHLNRDAYIADNRPWIDCSIGVGFDGWNATADGGGTFALVYEIKNFGKTPANNTIIDFGFIPFFALSFNAGEAERLRFTNIQKELEDFCNQNAIRDKRYPQRGTVLFPGVPHKSGVNRIFRPDEIAVLKGIDVAPDLIVVMVCVSYSVTLQGERRDTRAAFILNRWDHKRPLPMDFAIDHIPRDELVLLPFSGTEFAN